MLNKDKTAVLVAEFFGTFVLASTVLSVVSKSGIPFLVGGTAGLILAVMVMVLGKISGSHLNPAVTFGLWSAKKIPTTQAIVYIGSQLLGGLVALKFGEYLFDQKISSTLSSSIDWRVFAAEAVGTLVFTFGIAAALSQKFTDGKLAAAIGISLFAGISVASMGSNGVINPAVAIAVQSVNISYFIAPLVGAFVGVNAYEYIFAEKPKKSKTTSKSKKK